MRYLFATETGELFMLAFQIDALNQVLDHDISTGNDFPVSHDLVFNFDIYNYQKICNVERGIHIG